MFGADFISRRTRHGITVRGGKNNVEKKKIPMLQGENARDRNLFHVYIFVDAEYLEYLFELGT